MLRGAVALARAAARALSPSKASPLRGRGPLQDPDDREDDDAPLYPVEVTDRGRAMLELEPALPPPPPEPVPGPPRGSLAWRVLEAGKR